MRSILITAVGLAFLAITPAQAEICFGLGMKKFTCICKKFGFQEGTPDFSYCLQEQAAVQQRKTGALIMSLQPKPTTKCTTTQFGGVWRTTCN